ncbi:MAG: hypothetical protein J0M15_08245 [Deltaproteobacteria bacterium]|jgi:hypothetical protein|nr:hypothetical protein [Deltaproteobacteria bacterium]
MAFEEVVENLKSAGNSLKEKITESSLFQSMQERYQNLNPLQQKLSLTGLSVFFLFVVLYFPLDHYLLSNENTEQFESKRLLTKNLIKSHREVNNLSDFPVPQTSENMKSLIQGYLKEMNFLPEQIKYLNITSGSSSLIPLNKIQYGLELSLSKVNVRQITNIGSKLQSIHPALKLKDLLITMNKEDSRYQDGTFKLIALNIPKYIQPLPEPEPIKKNKTNNQTNKEEAE